MATQSGLDCKLYYDSTGSPTWVEITQAGDVTLTQSHVEISVSQRGRSNQEILLGQKTREISFEMKADKTSTVYEELRNAFNLKQSIFIAVMDGAVDTTGNEGVQLHTYVTNFTRNEPLAGNLTWSVTLKPAADAPAEPVWVEIA